MIYAADIGLLPLKQVDLVIWNKHRKAAFSPLASLIVHLPHESQGGTHAAILLQEEREAKNQKVWFQKPDNKCVQDPGKLKAKVHVPNH